MKLKHTSLKLKLTLSKEVLQQYLKWLANHLKVKLLALKEDIDIARSNDFGRKIFEAFANEYTTSHLNENSEVSKLMGVLAAKDKQLVEAKAFATKAKTLAESANKEKSRLVETAKRKDYELIDFATRQRSA